MFSPDLEKIFCHSQHFVENKKDGNHLVPVLVNVVDGVEQTSLNSIFFIAWFQLNVTLCYYREAQCFSDWWVWGVCLDFYAHTAAVKNTSLLCVFDHNLKTQNE